MGNKMFGNNFFDDYVYSQRSGRPHTSRTWNVKPTHRRSQTARERPISALDFLNKQNHQQEAAQRKRRREEEKRREAVAMLNQYDLNPLDPQKAIDFALHRNGADDIDGCIRTLIQLRNDARRTESLSTRTNTSPCASHSQTSPSASLPHPECDSDREIESEIESEADENDWELEQGSSEKESCVDRVEATQIIQGAVTAFLVRKDTKSLTQCVDDTSHAEMEALEASRKWEPWVLEQTWRDCKMLVDMPVDLLAYEETLLRIQMQLDNIQAGNVSNEARQMVRKIRREAVQLIQKRLDQIDTCKQWWKSHGSVSAAHGIEAEMVAVA